MDKKEYADPEILADGKVLLALKQRFLQEKTDEAMFMFMTCLRDSVVFVPMFAMLSDEDKARLAQGDMAPSGSVLFSPDILPHPSGLKFFPLFTQKEQLPKQYLQKGVTPLPLSVLRSIRLAKECGADSIVLDPYTQPCAIPMEAAQKIENLPSALSEEDQKALD